jgi:acetolactate synthase-1/3 small subunit
MAMRRGHHTSRVLKALGNHKAIHPAHFPTLDPDALSDDEILPTEFDDSAA